jgi:hypothetical protein
VAVASRLRRRATQQANAVATASSTASRAASTAGSAEDDWDLGSGGSSTCSTGCVAFVAESVRQGTQTG